MAFNPDAKYLSGYTDKAKRVEYRKQYAKAHPASKEKTKQRRKRYENSEKGKIRKRRFFQNLKVKILEKLGGAKCVKCGITDIRILTINHKNGGGTKERGITNSMKFWYAIRDGKRVTEDLDVRCFNCNFLYEYERGRLKEYKL